MSMRRFRTRRGLEGVEFGNGHCIIETPIGPDRYLSVETCERHHGRLEWIDPPRPEFSPHALASVVLPELLGNPGEFIGLLSWVTGITSMVWTPPLAVGLCRLARPHLEARFPWLLTIQRNWVICEDVHEASRQRDDVYLYLAQDHPGPHRVEPMPPAEVRRRMSAMKVAAAKPYPVPDVVPGGPLHYV